MLRLKTFIHAAAAAFFAIAAIAAAAPSQAQGRGSTGNVRIEIVKAGFIVGVQGGNGTLTFRGKSYPLNIGGVSLGATIGASRAVLVGTASNLHSAGDIVGTYGQAKPVSPSSQVERRRGCATKKAWCSTCVAGRPALSSRST